MAGEALNILMENIATIDEVKLTKIEDTGVVIFRPISGHQQGSCWLQPMKDEHTGLVKGAKVWTAAQKATTTEDVFEITAEMNFEIKDGTRFDLSVPREKAIWDCLKHCPQLGASEEEALSDPRILYYREDLDGDLEKKMSTSEQKFIAETFVRTSSSAKRREIMTLMGKVTRYLNDKTIEDYLIDYSRDAKGYLDLLKIQAQFESGTAKQRLFVKAAVERKIVVIDKNKFYYFGDTILGSTEEQVIGFIKNPANLELTKQIQYLMNPTD